MSILYFSINLERCCELPSFSVLLKKHCRFLGNLLQSGALIASNSHQFFSSVLSLYAYVLSNLTILASLTYTLASVTPSDHSIYYNLTAAKCTVYHL